MTKEEFKTIATERAKENYKNGMNCSESTFKAILDTLRDEGLTDFPSELTAVATGMGGGVGSTGHACGALTGAVMAAGIMHGRKNPLEIENLDERRAQMFGPAGVSRLFNNIVNDFVDKNGSANCKDLIAPFDYHAVDRRRFCRDIVGTTTSNAADWIFHGLEKGCAIPYRANIMGE